ncbi:hypothetical protein M758_UG150900 [Ceratodon purpureus]|nr:hypothetical protein M758_UG150900 [Ceratodon purpureus]
MWIFLATWGVIFQYSRAVVEKCGMGPQPLNFRRVEFLPAQSQARSLSSSVNCSPDSQFHLFDCANLPSFALTPLSCSPGMQVNEAQSFFFNHPQRKSTTHQHP